VDNNEFDLGPPTPRRDRGDRSWRDATIVGGLALALPSMLFGPPAIGYALDRTFGTGPWLFLTFLAVGFLGTAIDVYLILKRVKALG
jgi:hypothetical protein